MLPCFARNPLSRRSTPLTHFVIVLSQLLLVKGISVASWYSTEFAVHYTSNFSENKCHHFWSFQLHTVSSFVLLFYSHYKIKLTWRDGDYLKQNLCIGEWEGNTPGIINWELHLRLSLSEFVQAIYKLLHFQNFQLLQLFISYCSSQYKTPRFMVTSQWWLTGYCSISCHREETGLNK